jgi:hypothetical protein
MSAERVRDADGDIWEGNDADGWRLDDVDAVSWLPTRDILDKIFGPLSEVAEP